MSNKLGDMLLQANLIGKDKLASALEYQKSIGGKLGAILVKLNFIKEERLAEFLANQMKLPIIHLRDRKLDPELMKLVPRELVERHEIVPVTRDGDVLTVVTPEPTDFPAIDELAFVTGLKIQTALATRTEVVRAFQNFYYQDKPDKPRPHEGAEVPKAAGEAHPAAPAPAAASAGSATVHAKRGRAAVTAAVLLPPPAAGPLPEKPITSSSDKLARALAGLLIEKNVISLGELMDRVGREG